MVKVEETTQGVLDKISEGFAQKGAFNLRQNGISICHGDSEHIKIKKKEDKPGIDIFIDGETKGEKVFIPVVVSVSGMTDLVYNDFYVADGADVDIVAGCESTIVAVMTVVTMVFIPSMWVKMPMYIMRKNTTERGMEPEAEC